MRFLCTVGDSFLHGDGLIQTHCAEQFKQIDPEQLKGIAMGGMNRPGLDPDLIEEVKTEQDKLTISGKLSKQLNLENLNFAQGGASMEGILLQTHLLLEHLKKKNINVKETIWLVGITSQCRKMFWGSDSVLPFQKMVSEQYGKEYCWSRGTWKSLMLSSPPDSQPAFDKNLVKLTALATSDFAMLLHWAMMLNSLLTLLKAHKVEHYYFLNMFSNLAFRMSPPIQVSSEERELILQLLSSIPVDRILPGTNIDYAVMIHDDRCLDGHINANGNQKIVDLLLPIMRRVIAIQNNGKPIGNSMHTNPKQVIINP